MTYSNAGRGMFMTVGAIVIAIPSVLGAADCNQNGIDDLRDLTPGSLAFDPGQPYSVGVFPLAMIAADLDGTQFPSLVVAVPGGLSVLFNQGGKWVGPINHATGDFPISVVAADVDGDG